MRFIYQLKKINDCQMFFFIESYEYDIGSSLVLLNTNLEKFSKKKLELEKKPLACSYVAENIFILYEDSFVCYDIRKDLFKTLQNITFKFDDILSYKDGLLIYSLRILNELFFYEESILDTENKDNVTPRLLAKYDICDNIFDFKTSIVNEDLFYSYVEKLDSIDKQFEVNLNIIRSEYRFSFGQVDYIEEVDKDKILFVFSDFFNPTEIFILNRFKNTVIIKTLEEFILEVDYTNKKKLVYERKVHIEDTGVLVHTKKIANKNLMIILQGGPEQKINFRYQKYYEGILNYGYDIYLANYWKDFSKSKKHLNIDTSIIIIDTIIKMHEKYESIYLLGFSFGAYIALLSNYYTQFKKKIKKAIVIGCFTSIYYQFVFSRSRDLIIGLFDSKKNLTKYDPINLYKNSVGVNQNIVFIHGVNDYHCPIRQIDFFLKLSTSYKLIKLTDYSHFKIGFESNISNIILKECK